MPQSLRVARRPVLHERCCCSKKPAARGQGVCASPRLVAGEPISSSSRRTRELPNPPQKKPPRAEATKTQQGQKQIIFLERPATSSHMYRSLHINLKVGNFPGGPEAKTPDSRCRGPRFHPCSGNRIPYAPTKTWHSQINILKKKKKKKKRKKQESAEFQGKPRQKQSLPDIWA